MDFANTVRSPFSQKDALTGWADLVAFLLAAGLVAREHGEGLIELGRAEPKATAQVFASAFELRDAVRSILAARAAGVAVQPKWVDPINSILRVTEGYDQLLRLDDPPGGEQQWRLGFVARRERLEWLLAAIARSAAQLVAEGRDAPVRKCASPKCVLYFYDTSRTGGRRWCSMAVCGNRAKVARHARRAPPQHDGGSA